jgi:hypothetical protein
LEPSSRESSDFVAGKHVTNFWSIEARDRAGFGAEQNGALCCIGKEDSLARG